MADTLAIMKLSPVIPVVTIASVAQGLRIARDLYAGGIKSIEVTCRTPVALEAVREIAREVPELCLGVGTVWNAGQAREALAAGAQFMVSPGIADDVGAVCRDVGLPYLPGAQTVSEVAYLARQGWGQIKLFPASVIGGPTAITAYAAVFPDLHFCPTGGISEEDAPNYLALECIPCVGGSWLTRSQGYDAQGKSEIRAAAERATTLA